MQVVEMVRGAIKAHWVFSLVITVSAFTAWLLVANGHHGSGGCGVQIRGGHHRRIGD